MPNGGQQDNILQEPMSDTEQPGDVPPADMPHGDQMDNGGMMPTGEEQFDGQMDTGMEPSDGGEGFGDSEIMDVFNKLTDTDKKAVNNYAKSLLDTEEENTAQMQEPPMAENFVFKKGQIDKIYETFVDNDTVKEPIDKRNKRVNKHKTKSPFESPFA